jgi:hypothetical protein
MWTRLRCTTQEPLIIGTFRGGMTDIIRMWTPIAGGRKPKGGVAMENLGRMNLIAELAAAGKLRPVIDRSYPLGRIAESSPTLRRDVCSTSWPN